MSTLPIKLEQKENYYKVFLWGNTEAGKIEYNKAFDAFLWKPQKDILFNTKELWHLHEQLERINAPESIDYHRRKFKKYHLK